LIGRWQETIENQGFSICRNAYPSGEISYPTTLSSEDYITGQRFDRFPECPLIGQKGLNTVIKRIKRLATQYGTILCIRKLEWVN